MHVTVGSSSKALLTLGWAVSSMPGACGREQFLNAGKQIVVLLCFVSFRVVLVEHPDPRFWPLETFIEEFTVYLVTQGRTNQVLRVTLYWKELGI